MIVQFLSFKRFSLLRAYYRRHIFPAAYEFSVSSFFCCFNYFFFFSNINLMILLRNMWMSLKIKCWWQNVWMNFGGVVVVVVCYCFHAFRLAALVGWQWFVVSLCAKSETIKMIQLKILKYLDYSKAIQSTLRLHTIDWSLAKSHSLRLF